MLRKSMSEDPVTGERGLATRVLAVFWRVLLYCCGALKFAGSTLQRM